MPEPYVGEIRMFAGNFAPNGWMFCEGQTLPISENEVLFQLIGTTYGGDGEETFNLPNLASRVPIHMGTGPDGTTYQIGEMAGTEQETLTTQQIPIHTHHYGGFKVLVGTLTLPAVMSPASRQRSRSTLNDTPTLAMNAQAVSPTGGSQPHENTQAVSLYQLHHFIVWGVPLARPKEKKMSDPFVAEIRIFPFNFPPKGWAFCDGQLMPISQNTALFSLLGTVYGGDGKSTFALPDLQGSAPMQPGQGQGLSLRDLGEMSGVESITLLVSEIPFHTHTLQWQCRSSERADSG